MTTDVTGLAHAEHADVEAKIVEVGKVLHPLMLDTSIPKYARVKIHDALNDLTGAIVALRPEDTP